MPVTIEPDTSMAIAYEVMQDKGINCLIVCDGKEVVGVLKK